MPRLDDIRLYPVKGLRGVSVTAAEVEPWGLARDRRFMVVDHENRFITQRQVARMALIDADLLDGGLRLSTEGFGAIEVGVPGREAPVIEVTVWDDVVAARSADAAACAWLSEALAAPCRLVHMAEPARARPVDPDYAAPGDHVSFADGFPLLVTSAASLSDLNHRLDRPVPMERFRPNLVVGGAEPWAEDGWRRLRVGETTFDVSKDCARCVVTTIDQQTGHKAEDNEPLRTLGTFRRKAKGRIIFGRNLIPRGLGRIEVGAVVEADS